MNVFTYTDRLSARCFAIIAILSLIMSAFPAPFSFAEAATAIIGPANTTVSNSANRHDSTSANASSFTGLKLTFSYNAESLDKGDKFSYGWRSAGTDHELGSVNGKDEKGDNAATDETDSVTKNLPSEAQVADLQIYFALASNAAEDQVQITNYKVEGDPVVVEEEEEEEDNNEDEDEDEEENNEEDDEDAHPGQCPDGYDKIVDDYEDGLAWTSDDYYDSVILVGGPKNDNNDDPAGRNKYFDDVEPGDEIAREAHDISHICAIEGDEPEKGPAVIVATKIMCPDEAMLPNDGFSTIDANTAQNFLNENSECYVAADWQFQWAFGGKSNGESPDNEGALDSPWQTSDMTNGTGVVEIEIPADEFDGPTTISFREVMQPEHVAFTGQNGGPVSAEIYCTNDAANYDNLEWIPNVAPETTNYCVAWNVPTYEPEEIEVCKYTDSEDPVEGWKFTLTNGEEDGTFELTTDKSGCVTKLVNPGDGPWEVMEEDREGWTQVDVNADYGNVVSEDNESGLEMCTFFSLRDRIVKALDFTPEESEYNPEYRCVFVNTPPQICEDKPNGDWANNVEDYEQGLRKNNTAITDVNRTNPNAALGEEDWDSGDSTGFFSLGFGGFIEVSFDNYVPNVAGNDISIHEATNGAYPEEKAKIEVSQDGITWKEIGFANNAAGDKVTYLDFASTGWAWIKYVRVTDVSNKALHNDDADGFDLDAVDATKSVCDEPEEPLVCKPGVNLLSNPSFEDPEVDTDAGWDIFEDGTIGLAWVVDWVASFVGAPENAWLELHGGVNGWLPADGEQYAELDTDWQGPTGGGSEEASVAIGQTIATIPGETYTLKWQFSPRPNTSAAENELEVSIDGDVVKTNTAAGAGSNNWETDSYTFIATEDETKVTFADAGTPNSVGTFLDDVSLACDPEGEPEEETVTIVATKIVCEDEADLPNWGTGVGPQMIDADTATDWLEGHESCHLEEGWEFEWAAPGTSNPDNNLPTTAFYGEGGEDWNTFGPTNEDGVATVVLDEDDFAELDYLWMREVLKDGYIPFTYGPTNQFNSNNVSAELYCHTDVLNFDNYDRVDNIYGDNTYYCVAWNVEEEPAPMCDLTVVSDTTNTVATEGNPFAKLVTWFHSDWDAVVPFGAQWIWGDDPVTDPVNETIQTFEKKFMWNGPVDEALLTIAADNTYEITINGDLFGGDAAENNFGASDTHDLTSYIEQGENTLSIKVKNMAQGGGTIYTNPAGLNYALDIDGADESCRPNDDDDDDEDDDENDDDDEEEDDDDEEEEDEDEETTQTSGGNGKKVSLGGNNNDDEPKGEVAGDSTSQTAAPAVAGDQTSVYPAGAPNAGAGGAGDSSWVFTLTALFGALGLLSAVRKEV